MFRNTAQLLVRHDILKSNEPNLFGLTNELILECDKLRRNANPAEIEHIENSIPRSVERVRTNMGTLMEFILPLDPRLEFDGIKRTREFHSAESFNFR
jgi:hypothetical protein